MPQYYNRLFATGVRTVLTNDVATMALYRKWNPARGSNDVGVLSDTGCPSGREEVVIYTDDEDDNNQNRHSGWMGASTSERNTTLRLCRVDGTLFHPLAKASSTASDYVVFRLGDSCPPGSVEFQRYLDNEDNGNENYALGDSRPYVSDRNTTLYFCQFKGNARSGFGSLPNLGFSYGVFAARAFAYDSASGSFYTDDEDIGQRQHEQRRFNRRTNRRFREQYDLQRLEAMTYLRASKPRAALHESSDEGGGRRLQGCVAQRWGERRVPKDSSA